MTETEGFLQTQRKRGRHRRYEARTVEAALRQPFVSQKHASQQTGRGHQGLRSRSSSRSQDSHHPPCPSCRPAVWPDAGSARTAPRGPGLKWGPSRPGGGGSGSLPEQGLSCAQVPCPAGAATPASAGTALHPLGPPAAGDQTCLWIRFGLEPVPLPRPLSPRPPLWPALPCRDQGGCTAQHSVRHRPAGPATSPERPSAVCPGCVAR